MAAAYAGKPAIQVDSYGVEQFYVNGDDISTSSGGVIILKMDRPVDGTITVKDPFQKTLTTYTLKQQKQFEEKWYPEDKYSVSGTYTATVDAVDKNNNTFAATKALR